VGVGLIVDGKPTRGAGHCELGHIRVPRLPGDDWPGACPFHGACVEGLASGSAIAERVRQRGGPEDVSALAADDPLWETVAFTLAQLCHVLRCSTAPFRIAIGGGVLDRQPHLLDRIEPLLRASLADYVAVPDSGPYIVAPGLGDRAGPLGSIALAISAAA
jgi:fructokinase